MGIDATTRLECIGVEGGGNVNDNEGEQESLNEMGCELGEGRMRDEDSNVEMRRQLLLLTTGRQDLSNERRDRSDNRESIGQFNIRLVDDAGG